MSAVREWAKLAERKLRSINSVCGDRRVVKNNIRKGHPVKRYLRLVTCCCLVWGLSSCSPNTAVTDSDKTAALEPISCVAILPARMGAEQAVSGTDEEQEKHPTGADYADSVLLQELAGNPKAKFVPSTQFQGESAGNLTEVIGNASASTGCDAVLTTTVLRFAQRQGTSYAVDAPASAAFEMRIYSVPSGKVLWAGDFSETQQALMSNLFSFGKAKSRGFKWITVEELLAQGIKERVADCPYL